MDESRDPLVSEEEQAAALEAGAIGGESGMEDMSEEQRPVREAGGGEAEGFEMSREALADRFETPGEPGQGHTVRAISDEAEPDPATYSEPDEEDVTEKVSDPASGTADDPGEGPGIGQSR